MKVSTRNTGESDFKDQVECKRLLIEKDGKEYHLFFDKKGDLNINVEGTITITPNACNSIKIRDIE